MSEIQNWKPCKMPKLGDTLKWNEPLWAAPNKPRGKRDIIGQQEITAQLMAMTDVMEFKVIDVQKLSSGDVPLSVKVNDLIKRKGASLQKGDCQVLA